MFRFLIKRFFQSVIVVLIISLIATFIQNQLGDPTREMVGQSVTKEEREQLKQKLGLNDPFLVQYGRFIKNALKGDLGTSFFFKKSTVEIILEKLPATLELVFISVILIICLSIPMGVYTAIYPKSFFTKFIMSFSILGISIPVFLTAIFLIFFFSIELNLLPSYGRGETVDLFGYWSTNFLTVDGWLHIILPAISLSSIMLPLFIRLVSSEMTEVLSQEYIKFAIAKGMSIKKVWYKHALKNTLMSVVTVGGLQIGTMVAYTILTETVFQWPGMGFMFLEAMNRSDVPLITTYLIFVGVIFMVANTIVDLIYCLINPTVRLVDDK